MTNSYVIRVDVAEDPADEEKLTATAVSVWKMAENGDLTAVNGGLSNAIFDNKTKEAELTLEAMKYLDETASKTAFDFSLTLEKDGSVVETKKNDSKGKIEFSKLTFTNEDIGKTYVYKIREDKGLNTHIEYDETVYTVTVKVTRDETTRV